MQCLQVTQLQHSYWAHSSLWRLNLGQLWIPVVYSWSQYKSFLLIKLYAILRQVVLGQSGVLGLHLYHPFLMVWMLAFILGSWFSASLSVSLLLHLCYVFKENQNQILQTKPQCWFVPCDQYQRDTPQVTLGHTSPHAHSTSVNADILTHEHSPRVFIPYWLQQLSLESFRSHTPDKCIHKHTPKEASYLELSVINVSWGWGKGFSTFPVSNLWVCVPIVTERQPTLKKPSGNK